MVIFGATMIPPECFRIGVADRVEIPLDIVTNRLTTGARLDDVSASGTRLANVRDQTQGMVAHVALIHFRQPCPRRLKLFEAEEIDTNMVISQH